VDQLRRTIEPGVDFVLWPENTIDAILFATSTSREAVAAEAARLDAPIAVGITEDTTDGDEVINAKVVVTPEGDLHSRYVKVRRVPFGECVPLCGVLEALGVPATASGPIRSTGARSGVRRPARRHPVDHGHLLGGVLRRTRARRSPPAGTGDSWHSRRPHDVGRAVGVDRPGPTPRSRPIDPGLGCRTLHAAHPNTVSTADRAPRRYVEYVVRTVGRPNHDGRGTSDLDCEEDR
jgi:hypothetical protein